CPTTLAPAASCSVAIDFAPPTVGLKSAELTASADPGGVPSAALDGTGTADLTVAVMGGGSGTVTSDPAGIDCSDTCSATFSTATVTLHAVAGGLSVFSGWSGAGCAGTADCTVPMSQAQMVFASFTLTAAVLDIEPPSADFGSVLNDTMSTPVAFTVTNSGGAASGAITASTTTNNFTVTGGTCLGHPLAGGSSCTVTVLFEPMLPQFSDYNFIPVTRTAPVSARPGGSPTAALSATATCQTAYGAPCPLGAGQCCSLIPCINLSCHFP